MAAVERCFFFAVNLPRPLTESSGCSGIRDWGDVESDGLSRTYILIFIDMIFKSSWHAKAQACRTIEGYADRFRLSLVEPERRETNQKGFVMRKFILSASTTLLFICTVYFGMNVGDVHAAGVGKTPTLNSPIARVANSHAAFVTGDPFTTGCAQNVPPAISGTLEFGGTTVAWIYNYYSANCNTNWTYMVYDTSAVVSIAIDIHKQGLLINQPRSSNHQCFPVDCHSWYNGRLSPTWTDMVDGTPKDCVLADVIGKNTSTSTSIKYGSYDALCA